MKYVAGAEAVFQASFFAPGNIPVVLDADPTVEFFDLDDAPALEGVAVVISQVDTAEWSATILIPVSTDLGWYKIVWTALIDGIPAVGAENFELVAEGSVQIEDPEKSLRRRLRDVLADPPDDTDAFFMNDEIHSLLAMNSGDVIGAAYDGWLIRAAFYQEHIDIIESGSDRRMSQMFKNAMAMVDFYKKARDAESGKKADAIAGRVVGVVASLRGEYVDTFGLLASARYRASQSRGAYVRIFPLHRFSSLQVALLPSV